MRALLLIGQKRIILLVFFCLGCIYNCKAYSVLTHEALVDANWEKVILPLLKQKFPNEPVDSLQQARAFAYGGAVAPDMGYYPSGNRLFTNLVHYVRSGDIINELFKNAKTANEYAFAIGWLLHYEGDQLGHGLGINFCVPLLYPRMKRKFGDFVTYADNKISHTRTEFSFDVLQTARGTYASTAFHNFIGFQVSQHLMEISFMKIYGLSLDELFGNFSRMISKFRWTVINIFPEITKTAWQTRRREIRKMVPGAKARNFIYRVQKNNYTRDFTGEYKKPGPLAHLLSILIHLAPKIGPLRAFSFEIPGRYEEEIFMKSFDSVGTNFSNSSTGLARGTFIAPNFNLDTGDETKRGDYSICDKTYDELLAKLDAKGFKTVNDALRDNILHFYGENSNVLVEKMKKNRF